MNPRLLLLVALSACTGRDFDTSDTADDTDTGDSGDTDTGDTDTGDTDTADTQDTSDTGPAPQNWDFEDWTSSDPPPGFTKVPTADWTVTEGVDAVEGDAGASITLTATGATRRLLSEGGATVPTSAAYRLHAWLLDDDPDVAARLEVQAYTAGNLGPSVQGTDPSADDPEWAEYTLDVTTTTSDTLRPRLRVEEVTGTVAGSTIRTDAWAITRPHTFAPGDGVEDDVALPVLGTAPSLNVTAALNSDGTLYVATNHAEFGSDHLLFLWFGPPHATTQVTPPWDKGGLVAGPSVGGHLVVLVQEEAAGRFCEWLVWDGDHWEPPANDECSGHTDDSRLEGTLPLPSALGLSGPTAIPRVLYASVGPWESGTADDGELKAAFQVPAGDGDALIEADEVQSFSRVPLLVGQLDEAP